MNRYPEYKDSEYEWLGEVPEHWKVIAFKHCASIESSLVDPQLPEHIGRTLIAPNHVESGTGRILAEETAGDQGADSGKYLYDRGAVVYSKIRPALAKACIPREGGLCSADMYPLTPRVDVDSRFLLYILISDFFTDQAVLASERVAMPKVNRDTLNDFRVVLPPLAEQRQLAAYLDRKTAEVDTLIRKKQALIARLGELRAALIHRAVTKGLDPDVPTKDSGVEWLGEVPEHWAPTKLRYLASMVSGPFGSSLTKGMYVENGPYRVYGQQQVIPRDFSRGDYYISEETYKGLERCAVEPGDVLVSCMGTFGKTAVVPEGIEPGIINPRLVKLTPDRSKVLPVFLDVAMRAPATFSQLDAASRGGIMGGINIALLSEVQIALPPIDEQAKVVGHLHDQAGSVDSTIKREHQLIERLRELRTSLISEVVTGKVDVRAEAARLGDAVEEVAA